MCNSDFDSLRSELIDTLRLTDEHNLELVSIGIVVDKVSQSTVNSIVFDWDVYSDFGFQIHAIDLKSLDLVSLITNLGQELQADLVGLEDAILEASHVLD